jgi:hypothetical protein
MALACTIGAIANLDMQDPDAVQAMLQECTSVLLDPALWGWVLGLTLACAVVGALIGLGKGRWLAGLLWGAALGPIGWLIVALSRSAFPECPECSHRNAPNVKACRHCGVNLLAAAQRSARARLRATERRGGW